MEINDDYTHSEQQLIKGVLLELTNDDIAELLGVSKENVKTRLGRSCEKHCVKTRTGLAAVVHHTGFERMPGTETVLYNKRII